MHHTLTLFCVCMHVQKEEVIKEKVGLSTAMFTLSLCFPYKSQSHNISFPEAPVLSQRLRPEGGVVIWLHKTPLQRAVQHSNIYRSIEHRVISRCKGWLLTVAHLTGRMHGFASLFFFKGVVEVGHHLWEFDEKPKVVRGSE